jgi:hypothetical protein
MKPMKNIVPFPDPESRAAPTPEERYEAENTWGALREQTAKNTLSLLELAAFEPENTLEALISRYGKKSEDESFEARAVRNLELLIAEHVLKSEMTIVEATKLLTKTAGIETGRPKNAGIIQTLEREERRKRENEPDLNVNPDVMYKKLSDIPEALQDDASLAREIEAMEEEHLGPGALEWESMSSALHGLENTQFTNPNLTVSQAIIVLRGRMARDGSGKSGALLQKLEDLTAAHILKRSITIPAAIEFLKNEIAKEPKLKKLKE